MSPADGAIAVDPQARRREVEERLRALHGQAKALKLPPWRSWDSAPLAIESAADSVAEHGALCAHLDIRKLEGIRVERTPHVDEHPYYRSLVEILDEAIGLLRGLLPTTAEAAARGNLGANIIPGARSGR